MLLDGIAVGVEQGDVQVPGPREERPRRRLAVARRLEFPKHLLIVRCLDGDGADGARRIGTAAHGCTSGAPSSSLSIPSAACLIWRASRAAVLDRYASSGSRLESSRS